MQPIVDLRLADVYPTFESRSREFAPRVASGRPTHDAAGCQVLASASGHRGRCGSTKTPTYATRSEPSSDRPVTISAIA